MRVSWASPVLLAAVCAAPGFAQTQPSVVTTDQLIALNAKHKEPIFVDVRSWIEFQDQHIRGAIHIPTESIQERLPEKVRDKHRQLVFYCAAPNCRPYSRQAAAAAADIGYQHVFVYEEGLTAWVAAKQAVASSSPLPVVKPEFVSANEVIPVLEKKQKDTVVVDLRTRKEYSTFHLSNSINIPLDELEDKSKQLASKKVVFVCYGGGQSQVAVRLLSKTGRKNMCVLRGGISAWIQDHLPLLVGKVP